MLDCVDIYGAQSVLTVIVECVLVRDRRGCGREDVGVVVGFVECVDTVDRVYECVDRVCS